MDPFSITLGAGQIAAGCVQATVSIVKFCGELRTVDARIRGFYDEVVALQTTYEGLAKSLETPIMLEAARVANKTQDGAHLWSQVRVALDDSLRTVNAINIKLDEISKKSGFGRRVRTVLEEDLKGGELQRLRQRIQFFNATISLPIQMVSVMLALEQRGLSTEHQRSLDVKFMSIERSMREIINNLQSDRASQYSGSTLFVGTPNETTNLGGKESYLTFAKKILSSASAAASTRSSLSTVTPHADTTPLIELGGGTPPILPDRTRTMTDWIEQTNTSTSDLRGNMTRHTSMSTLVPDVPRGPGKATEVALKLAQQHLKLGQEKEEKNEHESAEKSFRKALQLLEKHDFSDRIVFQPAEVVLMLAHTCLMQKNYDEAIALLTPVAEQDKNIFPRSGARAPSVAPDHPIPDQLQALAASHMLGMVYKEQGDYESAKEHSLIAFMRRMDELGEHDDKTLESVRLLIDVYRTMGDTEEAEAYEVFLTPAPPKATTSTIPSLRESREHVFSDEQTAVSTVSPPTSDIMSPTLLPQAPTSQPRKPSRPSFTTRIKNSMAKSPQPNVPPVPSRSNDTHRNSFSRTSTMDGVVQDAVFLAPRRGTTFSSPSDTSYDRSNSYVDDDSTLPSPARLERTPSAKLLEPTFQAVEQLCQSGDFNKAIKIALKFIKNYDSPAFIIRRDELEKNIRSGIGHGLASTGKGYSPLHYFCELREQCTDEVSLILKYGADPSATCLKAGFTSSSNPTQLTPLGFAIARNHHQIVQLLLEHRNIKTDIRDAENLVPLLAAGRRRQYTAVRTLLAHHAPACIPHEYPSSWYGTSPLHDAARHCDLTLVEIYLANRHLDPDLLNVNGQDKFGKTPLMHAIIKTDVNDPMERVKFTRERRAVVDALLEAGADSQIIDDKGCAASWYAKREAGTEGEWLLGRVGEARYEMA